MEARSGGAWMRARMRQEMRETLLTALTTLAQAAADHSVAVRLSLGLAPTLRLKLVAMTATARFDPITQRECRAEQSETQCEQSQPHRGFPLIINLHRHTL